MFTGNQSILQASYFPPIELHGEPYECGLISLYTYNSIPNIDHSNNLLHIGPEIIELPKGSYEIDDIANYIDKKLMETASKPRVIINANTNTLQIEIKSSLPIYFNKSRTIGSLLGFSKRELIAHRTHTSDMPVNINKVNNIRVECNIVTGSFMNNRAVHTIHEFSTDGLPGYKVNEVPSNVIYLPVENVNTISCIVVQLVDQNGDLIDFRNEEITIRLHLRPIANTKIIYKNNNF